MALTIVLCRPSQRSIGLAYPWGGAQMEGGQRESVSEVQGWQGLLAWLLGGNGLSHARTPTGTYERQCLQWGKNTVYQFTIAAITNDHKLGSLKQHTFILWSWRSHVWNGSYGAKINGCAPSGGSSRQSTPCLFQILESVHTPWFLGTTADLLLSPSHLLLWLCPSYL